MKKFIAATTMCLTVSAFGQCAPEAELLRAMVGGRKETPVIILDTKETSNGPRHFILFASREKLSWTIVGTDRKTACIMVEGQGVTLMDNTEEKPEK